MLGLSFFLEKLKPTLKLTQTYQNLYHVVHVQNAHFWGGNGEKKFVLSDWSDDIPTLS